MSLPEPQLDQPTPPSRPVLEAAVCALEDGDSRKILDELAKSLDEVQGPDAGLVPIIISLATVIRWQARGMPAKAWAELAKAIGMLPLAMSPRRSERGMPPIELVACPTEGETLDLWTRRTARVAWRQRRMLADLHRAMINATQDVFMTFAVVEYLRGVEHCPWTWGSRQDDELGIARTRAEFLRRSMELQRFVRSAAADRVSPAIWRKNGGFSGLCAAALRWLASHEPAPWRGENPLAADVPMPCGWLRAYEYAVRWQEDTNR
jgi:hypothetical protein